jgi:hypothetical protein
VLNEQAIINELLSIEASAAVLMNRAESLRKKLQPVSTGGNQTKRGLSKKDKADFEARLKRRYKTA